MSATVQDYKYSQSRSLTESYKLLNKNFNTLHATYEALLHNPEPGLFNLRQRERLQNALSSLSEQMRALAEKMRENDSLDPLRYTQTGSQIAPCEERRAVEEPLSLGEIMPSDLQMNILFPYFSYNDLGRVAEVSRSWNQASRNSWRRVPTIPAIPQEGVDAMLNKIKEIPPDDFDQPRTQQIRKESQALIATLLTCNQWEDAIKVYCALNRPMSCFHSIYKMIWCAIKLLVVRDQIAQALILLEHARQNSEHSDQNYTSWIILIVERLTYKQHVHLALQLIHEKLPEEPYRSEAIYSITKILNKERQINKVIQIRRLIHDSNHKAEVNKDLEDVFRSKKEYAQAFEFAMDLPEHHRRTRHLQQIFAETVFTEGMEGIALDMLNRFPSMTPKAITNLAVQFAAKRNISQAFDLIRQLPSQEDREVALAKISPYMPCLTPVCNRCLIA